MPADGPERLKNFRGKIISVVSVIVDRHGNPQQPTVIGPAGFEFDEEALKAIKQYRFKPATDASGAPVAVVVEVQVAFQWH